MIIKYLQKQKHPQRLITLENNIKYVRIESYEPNKLGFIDSGVLEKLKHESNLEKLNLDNVVLGVITHSFENCQLPISFDAFFNDNTLEDVQDVKIVIRGCFNYGKKFHTELWKGYNHLAMIDFTNGIPELLSHLKPSGQNKRWNSNFILCQMEDLQQCKNKIKESKHWIDDFMKTKNNHIWIENNMEEYEFKKAELTKLIAKFENGQISFDSIKTDINELTGKAVDEHTLKTYWTYTSLNEFCDRLLTKPIKDWEKIDDERALSLIKEMLDNTSNDGILERNGEALEKKYNKITGYVSDLIFHSDMTNENEILINLKKNETIYL